MEAKRSLQLEMVSKFPFLTQAKLISQHIFLFLFVLKMPYMFPKLPKIQLVFPNLQLIIEFLWNFMQIVVLWRTKLREQFYFEGSSEMVFTCCMIPKQQLTLSKNSSNQCQNLLICAGLLHPLFVSSIIVPQLVSLFLHLL